MYHDIYDIYMYDIWYMYHICIIYHIICLPYDPATPFLVFIPKNWNQDLKEIIGTPISLPC